MRSMTRRPGTH
ncbi:hypothetical protein LINPERHAP1_LOCUS38186 [Linum perenne]